MTALIAIYDNPDKFPPTLNAICELSKSYSRVLVLCRANRFEPVLDLKYIPNCKIVTISDTLNFDSSILLKLFVFIRFAFALFYYNLKAKPVFNLIYDSYSLSAFSIIKYFIPKTKLWYHNHDVTDLTYVSKKSLTYWCWKIEQRVCDKIDLFSLPDLSRAEFFRNSSSFDFLPNYPSLKYNKSLNKTLKVNGKLKILYQGRVAPNHGIEELIYYLYQTNYDLEFHIIGRYDSNFKIKIKYLIDELQLIDKVVLHETIPSYHKLKSFSEKFDVGLAVFEPVNIQYSTAASASNKIYEYVALGMPVILYDSEHYRTALEKYTWAKFTDMSIASYDQIFADILRYYELYAHNAYSDYRTDLYFEKRFKMVSKKILT